MISIDHLPEYLDKSNDGFVSEMQENPRTIQRGLRMRSQIFKFITLTLSPYEDRFSLKFGLLELYVRWIIFSLSVLP